jgi:hypothetical protein
VRRPIRLALWPEPFADQPDPPFRLLPQSTTCPCVRLDSFCAPVDADPFSATASQVSTMTQRGASRIFAIDVGGLDDQSPRNYGDTVSGFYVLINRYNPWSSARHIPTLTEVTGRLT